MPPPNKFKFSFTPQYIRQKKNHLENKPEYVKARKGDGGEG